MVDAEVVVTVCSPETATRSLWTVEVSDTCSSRLRALIDQDGVVLIQTCPPCGHVLESFETRPSQPCRDDQWRQQSASTPPSLALD